MRQFTTHPPLVLLIPYFLLSRKSPTLHQMTFSRRFARGSISRQGIFPHSAQWRHPGKVDEEKRGWRDESSLAESSRSSVGPDELISILEFARNASSWICGECLQHERCDSIDGTERSFICTVSPLLCISITFVGAARMCNLWATDCPAVWPQWRHMVAKCAPARADGSWGRRGQDVYGAGGATSWMSQVVQVSKEEMQTQSTTWNTTPKTPKSFHVGLVIEQQKHKLFVQSHMT